jgi:AcrR family transcriptional regulator
MVDSFIRARKPAQKAQRRLAILDAAAQLLADGGLDRVGLNAIARQSGLTKSNLYRYFESREQILLELLIADEAAWVTSLEVALAPLAGSNDARAVGSAVARTLCEHERLCLLTTVLATVLEQNVSLETVVAFKQQALALSIRISNALYTALPEHGLPAIAEFAHYVHALVAGLWPITHPADVVEEAVERPEFAIFRHDFETDLRRSIVLLLIGLKSELD